MLGMYVHTHWGYNHPYAARSWTVPDWEYYLEGLSRLGFDTLKIWPQIDTMPLEPTPSDQHYLQTLAQAAAIAHARFGMKVILVLTANCMGNEQASRYIFSERPYFICEKKVNPGDPAEVMVLMAQRRNTLRLVPNADAIAIIDSDPGGFIGSTNAQFVDLCLRQSEVFRDIHPGAEFVYWMLAGWETYCKFWAAQLREADAEQDMWKFQNQDDFTNTLEMFKKHMPEPWWLTGWLPVHEQAADRAGVRERMMYYPYGLVEGEPTFPLTSCYGGFEEKLQPEILKRFPAGVMANAQSHCLQLPHTYWFSHLAQGGNMATADLGAFAERLLPGLGGDISAAWNVVESSDSRGQLLAAQSLHKAVGKTHRSGDLAGLLFGDPDRFLLDLALGLELRAVLNDFGQAVVRGQGVSEALGALLEPLKSYQRRVGFVDAYYGPLADLLNQPLRKIGNPGVNSVLDDFENWHNPGVRNGIVLRLVAAIQQVLAG